MDHINAKIEAAMKRAGIGFESINVFGTKGCCVHVRCISRDTADKWAILLNTVFKGGQAKVVPSMWEAKENKGTCLLPTMRKGYLIGISA